jgi:hypothetical protein
MQTVLTPDQYQEIKTQIQKDQETVFNIIKTDLQ